jgi:hypothetical protein
MGIAFRSRNQKLSRTCSIKRQKASHMKTVSILLLCYLIAYCQSIATKAYNVNGGMGDLNTRFSNDPYITRANAANLRLKFSVATSGDVTATPAVGTINGIDTAYFPDW